MPRTVAHRELRNNSAAILREVAAGETIAITNHGEIVAMLVPAPRGAVAGALRSRPATKTGGFSTLPRTRLDRPVQDDLDGSRGER